MAPVFVEHRGGVFLADRFTASTFDEFCRATGGTIQRVEYVINHVHLWDLFHIEESDADGQAALHEFCQRAVRALESALNREFPTRTFKVSFTDDETDYGPTLAFWSTGSH